MITLYTTYTLQYNGLKAFYSDKLVDSYLSNRYPSNDEISILPLSFNCPCISIT